MKRVVGFVGGPGSGKSSSMGLLFGKLKFMGVNCEMSPEYAKEATWEGRGKIFFEAQQHIYGEQSFRLKRLQNVDLIITDAPLIMSLVYMNSYPQPFPMPGLRDVVLQDWWQYDNLTVRLRRVKPYETAGRSQSLEEALDLDEKTSQMMYREGIPYTELDGGPSSVDEVIHMLFHKGWITQEQYDRRF